MYHNDFISLLKHAANIYTPIYYSNGNYTISNPYEQRFNSETGLINSSYYSEYTGFDFNEHYTSYYFSFGTIVDSDFNMDKFSDYTLINNIE